MKPCGKSLSSKGPLTLAGWAGWGRKDRVMWKEEADEPRAPLHLHLHLVSTLQIQAL